MGTGVYDKEGVSEIVDITLHVMGDWNGTGTCDGTGMHHGQAECYNDAYGLAADSIDHSKSFSFKRCMFDHMDELCPVSWDPSGLECGQDAYNQTSFQGAVTTCEAKAGYDAGALSKVALDGDAISSWANKAMVADFAVTAKENPGAPHPGWMVVSGAFIDDGKFQGDEDAWAAAVLKKVCETYTGDKPAGCN